MRPVLRLIFIKIDNQIKINIMKKSQLRQIIREEISRVLNEQEIKIPYMRVNDEKTKFEAEFELGGVEYSAEGNLGSKEVEILELYKDGENENSLNQMDPNLVRKIEEELFDKYESGDLNI